MLAALRCNCDCQIPYRFPVCAATTKCCICWQDSGDDALIIQATQRAQDAQTGYICDYCCKRSPMAVNEVKECIKGHSALGQSLTGCHIGYIGKRHLGRFLTDAYGKGIVRGQVENTNLRANYNEADATASESFKTCDTVTFQGKQYLELILLLNDKVQPKTNYMVASLGFGRQRKRRISFKDAALFYGHRPFVQGLDFLSPYEFHAHWEAVMATIPSGRPRGSAVTKHTRLTCCGVDKINQVQGGSGVTLVPGVDYVVTEGGIDWMPFPDVESTQHFRHEWVLTRRRRPVSPTFLGSPVPKHGQGTGERSAAIVMAYFHPWTLQKANATEYVPLASELRPEGHAWRDVLAEWLAGGLLCEESKQCVSNFIAVHRMRPAEDDVDANSDDIMSDEELVVTQQSIKEALDSRIGGRQDEMPRNSKKRGDGDEWNNDLSHHSNSEDAMALAQCLWADAGASSKGSVEVGFQPKDVKSVLAAASRSRRSDIGSIFSEGMDASDGQVPQLHSHNAIVICCSVVAVNQIMPAWNQPQVLPQTNATCEDIDVWLADLKTRRDADGRRVANDMQLEAVSVIVTRLKEEVAAVDSGTLDFGEPLRWMIHGGPGTGKSHVLTLVKELFIKVLRWDQDVQFTMVALQAVMADLLGGDTIHHALGIPVFGRGRGAEQQQAKESEVARRVLQLRWLIIDEFSMVSARLFATIDLKLRQMIREVSPGKMQSDHFARAFGGERMKPFCK